MARAFRYGNFALYVWDERGAQHHRPHAHIYERGQHVGSVFLETLNFYDRRARLPKQLVEKIVQEQNALIDLWMELNPE